MSALESAFESARRRPPLQPLREHVPAEAEDEAALEARSHDLLHVLAAQAVVNHRDEQHEQEEQGHVLDQLRDLDVHAVAPGCGAACCGRGQAVSYTSTITQTFMIPATVEKSSPTSSRGCGWTSSRCRVSQCAGNASPAISDSPRK